MGELLIYPYYSGGEDDYPHPPPSGQIYVSCAAPNGKLFVDLTQ